MGQFLSRRLQGMVQSDIRRMSRECERLGGLNLGQGICDLPTHPYVAEGAIEAIRKNQAIYTLPEGIRALREVIAAKVARDNGLDVDPLTEIVVTSGSSGAFACTINALLNAGDGILLFEPYYGYHLNTAILAGLEPHFCTLEPPNFDFVEERIRAALKPNTRAIVLCTPSNPSGKMLSREEIEMVARIAREHDLLVITDEIYEYIVYDERKHLSPATVADLWDRTVTIMGMSKTFSITGWRLGYVVAKEEFARPITLVNDLYYVCAPHPLQYGALAGFSAPHSYFAEMRHDYQAKREMIASALGEAGLPPVVPQGAYYMLADVSSLGFENSLDAAMEILTQAKVASVPGRAFYQSSVGESLVRFCFAKDDDVLRQACDQLVKYGATRSQRV